jgi:hypothetical protein
LVATGGAADAVVHGPGTRARCRALEPPNPTLSTIGRPRRLTVGEGGCGQEEEKGEEEGGGHGCFLEYHWKK